MKLVFLGACRQVGKSCVYAQVGQTRVLLDVGLKVHDHNEAPRLNEFKWDAAIVSHAHLDHSGASPVVFKNSNAPLFATPPTIPVTKLLLADSERVALKKKKSLPYGKAEVKKLYNKFIGLGFGRKQALAGGARFSFIDAGHILGSAQILVEGEGKRLLYTGDLNAGETRMHAGAASPDGEVDALVIESTYANRDHPPRAQLERDFTQRVQDALDDHATVLVPCFAVGRTQEIIQVLQANHVHAKIFLDGMGREVNEIAGGFPSYVKNIGLLYAALNKARAIESRRQRGEAAKIPCVIISSAGMLDGGPALYYLQALNKRRNGVVFLTGHQVEGTNGWRLLHGEKILVDEKTRKEKIVLPATQFDFSAHSGRTQLFDYVKRLAPQKVFCIHGDAPVCDGFAEELRGQGFDAVAPKEGEKFVL